MTPDEMRAKAKELYEDSKKRLTTANLGANIEIQIAVTADQTAATMMAVLADVVETLNPDAKASRVKEYLAEMSAKNDALRKAAAKGFSKNDWSDFDRIVDGTQAVSG